MISRNSSPTSASITTLPITNITTNTNDLTDDTSSSYITNDNNNSNNNSNNVNGVNEGSGTTNNNSISSTNDNNTISSSNNNAISSNINKSDTISSNINNNEQNFPSNDSCEFFESDLLNLQLSFDASSNCPQTSSNPPTFSIPSHIPSHPSSRHHTLTDHRRNNDDDDDVDDVDVGVNVNVNSSLTQHQQLQFDHLQNYQQQQQQHNYQYQYHHHNYHQPKRQRQRQNQNHFPYHLPHQPHPNNNNGFEYQFGPQSSSSTSLSSMQNINTEYISNSSATNANIILPPLSTPIPPHSIIIPSALMPVSNPRCSPIQTNIPNECIVSPLLSPTSPQQQHQQPQYDSNYLTKMIAADEEKRQRNTLASARFRIRRKMKEQELERVAKEMTEKARSLECKVKELEKEVKLLKGLIVEIDSTRLVKTRNNNNKELLKKVDNEDGQRENCNYMIRDHVHNSNYHDNSAGVGSSSGTNLGFSINDIDVGDGRSNQ